MIDIELFRQLEQELHRPDIRSSREAVSRGLQTIFWSLAVLAGSTTSTLLSTPWRKKGLRGTDRPVDTPQPRRLGPPPHGYQRQAGADRLARPADVLDDDDRDARRHPGAHLPGHQQHDAGCVGRIAKAKDAGAYRGRPEDAKRNDAIMATLRRGQTWESIRHATRCSNSTIARLAKRVKATAGN